MRKEFQRNQGSIVVYFFNNYESQPKDEHEPVDLTDDQLLETYESPSIKEEIIDDIEVNKVSYILILQTFQEIDSNEVQQIELPEDIISLEDIDQEYFLGLPPEIQKQIIENIKERRYFKRRKTAQELLQRTDSVN